MNDSLGRTESRTALIARVRRALVRTAVATVTVVLFASTALAQMTVSGRVTASERPVAGATVQVPDLRIETRTAADGSFSMIIPNSAIRGQRVRIIARDRRLGSQALDIALEGRPLAVDFVLGAPSQPPPRGDTARVPREPGHAAAPSAVAAQLPKPQVDSSAFFGAAASRDVGSALAGRIAGLLVTTPSAQGASTPMVFRGPRSITGSSEPLIVVDGVPIDTRSLASGAQRFGLGGFDYGTALQDLPIDDIGTVTLLDGAAATIRYGSRAANGVLLIDTKRAGNAGWEFGFGTRYLCDALGTLPSYQNQFGQGLGGEFEFFDGAGGGINDNVAENWGPALQGQPVVQASYLEPRRPDVRPWVPHSLNVRRYFEPGGTFDAFGSLGFGDDLSGRHMRGAIAARSASGLTPGAAVSRLSAALGGDTKVSAKLTLAASARVTRATADDRPGTGFDETNPVSQFARMGRQVDMDSLRAHLVSGADQINWIYSSFNNPFFQALRNSNADTRTHALVGATADYALTDKLRLTFDGGFDHIGQDRGFTVAAGWTGGYPTALGRGDFSGGGSQQQSLSSSATRFGLALATAGRRVAAFDVDATLGAEARSERFDVATAITDRPATGSASQSNDERSGDNAVRSIFASASGVRGGLTLTGGLRAEMPAQLEPVGGGVKASRETSLFPAVSAAYDVSSSARSLGLESALVRASWWRAGNEVTSRSLADAYAGIDASVAPRFGIAADGITGPEVTTGLSLGVELRSGERVGTSVIAYREKSSNLVVVTPDIDGNPVTSQEGGITNTGVEAQLALHPLTDETRTWDVVATLAKNSSTVDAVGPGASTMVPLGPTFVGATLAAATGSPFGVIVGTRFLRAADGQLVLRNGLPIADATGASVLGSIQPDWSASLSTTMRVFGLELAALLDARIGGHLFSGTNRWGQYSGTLEETLAGRDTGMVVAGVDSITGQPSSVNVTAESYFHALGGITEAFVYDASYAKLRDVRLSYATVLGFLPGFRDRTTRISLVGRNLFTWTKAPNIDSETALSTGVFQGFEMGQLPGTRSLGLSLSIAP